MVFALSGRVEQKDVSELEELLQAEAEGLDITLELGEVRLVDREAVRFFADCEAQRIKLENCPSYIREWIKTGSNNKP